jgi:2-(3-amino-3-carboxypropyl)histidine synthase
MYVFVEVQFDGSHLIDCIKENFSSQQKIALMATIQFISCCKSVRKSLDSANYKDIVIPQARPLSAGETLGCTSPCISKECILIFVADGRFHLESAMIKNPTVEVYRYDPYSKILSKEGYQFELMKIRRFAAITSASTAYVFGLILGTLGRQGNPKIFDRMEALLTKNGKKCIRFLMAEIRPEKLNKILNVDVWIQIACPRLSIDWGKEFSKPLLTPYELEVAFGEALWTKDTYPMDYYANDGGSWSNMYHSNRK